MKEHCLLFWLRLFYIDWCILFGHMWLVCLLFEEEGLSTVYEGTYGEDEKYKFRDLLFFCSNMSITVSSWGEVTVEEKLEGAFV
jgi:hypothetical protein